MKRIVLSLLLGVAASLLLPRAAWAVRCGSQLVQQGDQEADVRARCGEPFFIGRYQAISLVGRAAQVATDQQGNRYYAPVLYEAWYYNFGPSQLMVRLLFANGEVQREQTLGYGFSGAPGPCDPDMLLEGMGSGEVFARCGAPAHATDNGRGYPPFYQSWYYPGTNGGRERVVHLLNGRVEDVKIVN